MRGASKVYKMARLWGGARSIDSSNLGRITEPRFTDETSHRALNRASNRASNRPSARGPKIDDLQSIPRYIANPILS